MSRGNTNRPATGKQPHDSNYLTTNFPTTYKLRDPPGDGRPRFVFCAENHTTRAVGLSSVRRLSD